MRGGGYEPVTCPHCGDIAPHSDGRMSWLLWHIDSRIHRWWWRLRRWGVNLLYQLHPHRVLSKSLTSWRLDGGYLAGPVDAARAADVRLEDLLGPPPYVDRDVVKSYRVESTHVQTVVTGMRHDGLKFNVFHTEHPNGLS